MYSALADRSTTIRYPALFVEPESTITAESVPFAENHGAFGEALHAKATAIAVTTETRRYAHSITAILRAEAAQRLPRES
jgi:hypothetical protein